MIPLAGFCCVIVAVVGISATPRLLHRPLGEIIVDALYRSAMRASARAVAADQALVAYRREMESMRAAHRPRYAEGA